MARGRTWQEVDSLVARHRQKRGLRGKITAKCIECSYDPLDKGTWRQQVEDCRVPDCPLYDVRPLPRGVKHEDN